MPGPDRFEPVRGRWLVLVVALTALVASSCSPASETRAVDARRGLELLGRRWFASSATITYRTTERDPGEATSPHQCLRQFVEVDVDELGTAGVTVEGPRTIAGMRAECFRATGGSADAVRRVEWCFSRGGLLLSLFDGVQDGRVTTVEATRVSTGVSASTSSPRERAMTWRSRLR